MTGRPNLLHRGEFLDLSYIPNDDHPRTAAQDHQRALVLLRQALVQADADAMIALCRRRNRRAHARPLTVGTDVQVFNEEEKLWKGRRRLVGVTTGNGYVQQAHKINTIPLARLRPAGPDQDPKCTKDEIPLIFWGP